MRYVFDLDGTLCRTHGMEYDRAEPRLERIQRVAKLREEGHEVIIDTARAVTHHQLTELQLRAWGVMYDELRVGQKVAAERYVDDRATNAADWFGVCAVEIDGRPVGPGHPTFVIAEVGINHNGDLETALELVDAAAEAGAHAVKFQVGDPRRYVNRAHWNVPRQTPWGLLSYIEYRKRMEFTDEQLAAIRDRARSHGLVWFASPLEASAVDRLERLGAPVHKVASPRLTDAPLLEALRATGKPVILSTGMSTLAEIDAAVEALGTERLILMHCTSAYPCPPALANLRVIQLLRSRYGVPVGYSGHEVGVPESVAAVALGACAVERHLTLSRAMWGSDHAASLEPTGLETLCRYVRTVDEALGDGEKRVYAAEAPNLAKFRRPA